MAKANVTFTIVLESRDEMEEMANNLSDGNGTLLQGVLDALGDYLDSLE